MTNDGVGGRRGLFGPRFTKTQRQMAQRYLEAAGWDPKRVDLASLSGEFAKEYGVGRDDGSFRRLLGRLAKRHRRKSNRTAPKQSPTASKPTGVRAYDGPSRFSPAEEQAIISISPDCVIVEHTIDYDAIIQKLNGKFPERRGKWNRDGIRAILKRHDIYDQLLQGKRPVPFVVRPPTDPLEHYRRHQKLVAARMDEVRAELRRLTLEHIRAVRAINGAEASVEGLELVASEAGGETQFVLPGGVVARSTALQDRRGPDEPKEWDVPFA